MACNRYVSFFDIFAYEYIQYIAIDEKKAIWNLSQEISQVCQRARRPQKESLIEGKTAFCVVR